MVNVNMEDLLQSIDSVSAGKLKLVSDYIMKLVVDDGQDLEIK